MNIAEIINLKIVQKSTGIAIKIYKFYTIETQICMRILLDTNEIPEKRDPQEKLMIHLERKIGL